MYICVHVPFDGRYCRRCRLPLYIVSEPFFGSLFVVKTLCSNPIPSHACKTQSESRPIHRPTENATFATLKCHSPSKLHIIIHQPDLLARLERRQANVRASVTPERIAQRAVAARTHFALHGEVHFRQVLGLQFGQVGVCLRALRSVFGVEALRETAAAVFASTAALSVGEACFGCWRVLLAYVKIK